MLSLFLKEKQYLKEKNWAGLWDYQRSVYAKNEGTHQAQRESLTKSDKKGGEKEWQM